MAKTIATVDVVAAQWDTLVDETASREALLSLHALTVKARANTALGQLYPFLSVGRLCFSRCTEFPFYVDVLITPSDSVDEYYLVEKTIGQGGWVDTTPVKRVQGAEAATRLAASLLPDGYGPARPGNADEWREEFNQVALAFRELTPRSEDH